MNHSTLLQDLPADSPVFVHQIDLLSPVLQKETSGSFYLDEVIIADRAVTGKGVGFCVWFFFLFFSVNVTVLLGYSIMGWFKLFQRGRAFHNRHKNNFVFSNLHLFVETIMKELPNINIHDLFENVFLQM